MRLGDLLRLQIVQRFDLVDAWFQIGQIRNFKTESLIQKSGAKQRVKLLRETLSF